MHPTKSISILWEKSCSNKNVMMVVSCMMCEAHDHFRCRSLLIGIHFIHTTNNKTEESLKWLIQWKGSILRGSYFLLLCKKKELKKFSQQYNVTVIAFLTGLVCVSYRSSVHTPHWASQWVWRGRRPAGRTWWSAPPARPVEMPCSPPPVQHHLLLLLLTHVCGPAAIYALTTFKLLILSLPPSLFLSLSISPSPLFLTPLEELWRAH